MNPLGKSLCLFMIFATVRGMAVGNKSKEFENKNKNDEDFEESSIEELDDIKPLSDGAEDIWNQMFSGNHSNIPSTLLPKTVYDFQTGELSYFNGDLNSSSSDDFSIKEELPDYLNLTDTEDRPRRYSSKYVKNDPEEGEETNPDAVYKVVEDSDKNENPNNEEEKEPLKTDSNEHHEHKKKGGNKKHSDGKGEEHHKDHHEVKGSKGHKDYKGEHHHHKGEKGHHDKESHKGQYSDKKGSKKAHKEGGGHFEAGVSGEKGHKDAKHNDKEEYKKGHSTRGGHVVHKKDEYEKKHEFYDEHHEGGEGEKHGEYHEEHQAKSGGHKKGGHKHGGSAHDHKGKKGHYDKGKKYHEDKGHKKAGGEEKKHEHDEKYGKKEGHSNWKKYAYDNGKGGGGGGGGGGHGHKKKGHYEEAGDGSHGHLRAVIYHDPSIKPQVKDKSHQEESSHIEQVQLADAVAAENARPPVPATELRPPPIHQPKVIIKQFRFPPVAVR